MFWVKINTTLRAVSFVSIFCFVPGKKCQVSYQLTDPRTLIVFFRGYGAKEQLAVPILDETPSVSRANPEAFVANTRSTYLVTNIL